MADSLRTTGGARGAAFGLAAVAGGLFCLVWGWLIGGDDAVRGFLLSILAAGVAAGVGAYRTGSSPERIGGLALAALFVSILLDLAISLLLNPLEGIRATFGNGGITLYVVNIAWGSALGALLGRPPRSSFPDRPAPE